MVMETIISHHSMMIVDSFIQSFNHCVEHARSWAYSIGDIGHVGRYSTELGSFDLHSRSGTRI